MPEVNAMIIGKPSDPAPAQPAVRTGGAGAAGGKRVEPGVASDARIEAVETVDSVKLSDAGRALTAALRTPDEIRADKVAVVKRAVEDGTYRVRADAVADRLISDAAEFLGAMKSSR